MLVLENVGTYLPVSRMTVIADTKEEALQAMKDIVEGNVDTSSIPKSGYDIRKKHERH